MTPPLSGGEPVEAGPSTGTQTFPASYKNLISEVGLDATETGKKLGEAILAIQQESGMSNEQIADVLRRIALSLVEEAARGDDGA